MVLILNARSLTPLLCMCICNTIEKRFEPENCRSYSATVYSSTRHFHPFSNPNFLRVVQNKSLKDFLLRSHLCISNLNSYRQLCQFSFRCYPLKCPGEYCIIPDYPNKRPTGLNGHLSINQRSYTDFLSEGLIFVYQ